MNKLKTLGLLLIFTGLLTLAGVIVNHNILWSIVDVTVILVCCVTGIYLLKISKST